MEIKKYNPQGKSIISFTKSEQEMRIGSNDGSKGSEDNPYLLGEYIALYLKGEWTGGYVEGIGYVGKDQSCVSFPSTSEIDWEKYFSSVFSFLSCSQALPSGITIPSASKSNDNNTKYDYQAGSKYRSVMMDGVHFDFRFLIVQGWATVSCSATSSREIRNNEFFIDCSNLKIDLNVYNESCDGYYKKYTFQTFSFSYMQGDSIALCNRYSGESIPILD